MSKSGVKPRLGNTVPKDLQFTNSSGQKVTLGNLFDGKRPVLLTLNYYRCTTICDIMLNSLANTLQRPDWPATDDYRVVTVSIDPNEPARLARTKRNKLLTPTARKKLDWHFLVGSEENIAVLAKAIGFEFAYDAETTQWAHPSAIVVVSPKGTIKAYRYGVTFVPRTLRFSLLSAAEGSIGSVVEQVVMSCYRFDDGAGKYVPYAWGFMRLAASGFATLLAGFLLILWRSERKTLASGGAL